MKIKSLMSIVALGMAVAAYADVPGVSVVDREGVKKSFVKADVASIALGATDVTVTGKDGHTTVFGKKQISAILLSDAVSAIKLVAADGTSLSIKASAETVVISNAKPHTGWTLCDLKGIAILSGKTAEVTETIDIAHLHPGVYLITVAGKSVKFIKR